jgi:hypothetical protein
MLKYGKFHTLLYYLIFHFPIFITLNKNKKCFSFCIQLVLGRRVRLVLDHSFCCGALLAHVVQTTINLSWGTHNSNHFVHNFCKYFKVLFKAIVVFFYMTSEYLGQHFPNRMKWGNEGFLNQREPRYSEIFC